MGKRIPGKKHKGVKDPMIQKAKREESLKNVINAPPKDLEQQELPKSVEKLMKLKQMTREGIFNKRKKKNKNKIHLMDTAKLISKEKILPGMSKSDRNLPALVQRPNESDRAFLNRLHTATNDFIKEVNFEVKHNMKMKRDEKTGVVKFEKVEVHPVDKMFQEKLEAANQKQKKRKKKKGSADIVIPEGLSKTARRRLKMQARKEKLMKLEGEPDRGDEFNKFQDKVEFNEVVHRPPQLTALPKKSGASDVARRPASKPGLLLSHLLVTGTQQRRDLTGRRRDLSMSDRRRLETAQTDAIMAYKQMKAARAAAVR